MLARLAAAALAAFLVVSSPVIAADGYAIDLKPLVDLVVPPLVAALGTLVLFVLIRVNTWLGGAIGRDSLIAQATLRDAVHKALDHGAALALARLNDASFTSITTRSEAVAAAVRYVVDHVPGAVKGLGLDPATLPELVEARLAKLDGSTLPYLAGVSGEVRVFDPAAPAKAAGT